jgi:hypothetical protein
LNDSIEKDEHTLNECGDPNQAGLRDEARPIAANIAKLPDLVGGKHS